MKKIAIFGSTGSIGSCLLKVIKEDKKNFKIELLTANKNYKKLIKQAKFFNVKNIVVTDYNSFLIATKLLKNTRVKVFKNFDSLNKIFNNDEPIDPVDPKIAIFFILNNYKQKNSKWNCKNYTI